MSHIRGFQSYKDSKKNSSQVVKESVLQVDDVYKVRVIVDVKKSFVNSYVKKVEDNTQKKLRDFYSDMDIVEELVKNVVETGMNVEQIPATLLVGGSQTQAQPAQAAQVQTEPAPQAQPQSQPQAQPQAQVQSEPAQTQGQAPQGEAQGFEEVQPQAQEEEEEGEEELPA